MRGVENFLPLDIFVGSVGLGDATGTEGDGRNAVLRQNSRVTEPRRADERSFWVTRCFRQFLHKRVLRIGLQRWAVAQDFRCDGKLTEGFAQCRDLLP